MLSKTIVVLGKLVLILLLCIPIIILGILHFIVKFLFYLSKGYNDKRVKALVKKHYNGDLKAMFLADVYTKRLKVGILIEYILCQITKWTLNTITDITRTNSKIASWNTDTIH